MRIGCSFTYPPNTVTEPYRRIWFKGDPINPVFETNAIKGVMGSLKSSERECTLSLNDARKGQTDGQ